MNLPPNIPLAFVKRTQATLGAPDRPRTPLQVAITPEVTVLAPVEAAVDVVVALLVVVAVELHAVHDAALDPATPQSSTKKVRQACQSCAHNLARCGSLRSSVVGKTTLRTLDSH
ncbi:hypothetical protein ON010_g8541 [Phytophthora cinnamomi]|nr:hypothetical protein ON010_g8541 [Phytophthora cinnamomi]